MTSQVPDKMFPSVESLLAERAAKHMGCGVFRYRNVYRHVGGLYCAAMMTFAGLDTEALENDQSILAVCCWW